MKRVLRSSATSALAIVMTMALAFISGAATAEEPVWRDLDPQNIVYLRLPDGQVAIELNPVFAPRTVAQFKRLVRGGFYNGLSFYRVVPGFVAQGGDGSDMAPPHEVPGLPPEFERAWSDELPFVSVQKPALFAPETGFIDGFAAARDLRQGKVWLAHCPGVVAMARNNAPDTGNTDFYIVIGQAPRYLDRNLTIFGRVVYGMDAVQRIIRGPVETSGMIAAGAPQTRIVSAVLAADVAADERLHLQVADTDASAFQALLDSRRVRDDPFFHVKPPEVLDVCQVPIRTRIAP